MNTTNNSSSRYGMLSGSILCILAYLAIYLLPQTAAADTITNGSYSIDVDNIDTNPQPTNQPITPPQVLGTKTINEFTTGPNYTVTSSNDLFGLKLSQYTIDYGILSSTNPVIRTSNILLSNPYSGAQVIADENHTLLFSPNQTIQNTSCDNGDCSTQTASLWNNPLTYGFGYRCDSPQLGVCDPQFTTSDYFKQFPSDTDNQLPEIIMTSTMKSANTKGTITYKVNISGTQKTGAYYNSITYLALPNF